MRTTRRYWERKKAEYAQADHRRLLTSEGMQDMGAWVLGDPTATNMDEYGEYVARATVAGSGGGGGLFAHESEHASFQIMTPAAKIRLTHGRLHQLPERDPTDRFDIPDHVTWQMNLAIDHNDLSVGTTGILGETLVPTGTLSCRAWILSADRRNTVQQQYNLCDDALNKKLRHRDVLKRPNLLEVFFSSLFYPNYERKQAE